MSLFSRKPKNELVLLLDIQSSLVRGSLLLMPADQNQKTEVVFTHNKEIPYRKNGSSTFLTKSALHGVAECAEAATRFLSISAKNEGLPGKIRSIHYGFSSPWAISQAMTITKDFPDETEMTRSRVMDIVKEQRTKQMPDRDDTVTIIEEKIFDVRLNGYSISSWEGRSAKQVDISFVMSAAGTETIRKFKRAVSGTVPERRVHFHSSLLLQTIGIRAVMPGREAYTLIHVHGELTDVVVVDRGSCVFFGSYPTGIRTIVRKIAKATGTDDQAADSLITLYLSGHLDPAKEKAVSTVMNDISSGWISEYNRLFVKGSAPMPSVDHPAIIFCRFHESFFVKSFSNAHSEAIVGTLSLDKITPYIEYRPRTDRMRVTGLCAAALRALKI